MDPYNNQCAIYFNQDTIRNIHYLHLLYSFRSILNPFVNEWEINTTYFIIML